MARKDPPKTPDEAALKRLAMGVFLQLPTDLDEADQVLAYLGELIKWHRGMPYAWLEADPKKPSDDPSREVVHFMKRG